MPYRNLNNITKNYGILRNIRKNRFCSGTVIINSKIIVNTHVHADHVTGSGLLKKHVKHVKSMIGIDSKAKADIYLKDGKNIEYFLRILFKTFA